MTDSSQEQGSFTQAISDEKAVLETGFHIVPTVAEAEVGAVVERVRTSVEKVGGSIIAQEMPKRMQLAYRIERPVAGKREKYTESYFGWIKFEAPKGAAKQIEHDLHEMTEILRFIIIHTTREAITFTPRVVFSSDRLEGKTIEKPAIVAAEEKKAAVSEEELDKSIDSLVS